MATAVGVSQPIVEISLGGFKSIADEQSVEIRPLTILAGKNSSGKSSMMQPLLLLKQTLESSFDPGALLLNGPNANFTSVEQLLSRIGGRRSSDSFHVGVRLGRGGFVKIRFRKRNELGFIIEEMELSHASKRVALRPGMTDAEIVRTGVTNGINMKRRTSNGSDTGHWEIRPERCFLDTAWVANAKGGETLPASMSHLSVIWEATIQHVIHLPGLRGNPERTYPATAIGPGYPGTFEKYTATIIAQWMKRKKKVLSQLSDDLRLLGLTGGVMAIPLNAAQIELVVGRLPQLAPVRPEDRVSVADVGIGVSQTLPVLVGLHAAEPDRLVYLEQPETHLHPRAQFDLARVLAIAANRGVRVVVETHSSLLLLGVQTLVAEGILTPDKVKLHWFERGNDGKTTIRPAELDEAGRFGDWPADFDDVTLKAESRFLDAAEARLAKK